MTYQRNSSELESKACKWWPENLVALEAEASIIPILVRTQDNFIAILQLADDNTTSKVFNIIDSAKYPANLFLKHLMVLTDFGSEPLQRVNSNFDNYFPEKMLKYAVNGQKLSYEFSSLPIRGNLTNKKMYTSVGHILTKKPLDNFFQDLIVLLLFGGNAIDESVATIFRKCTVGNIMGKPNQLEEFIKQRYIFVSRITGGAQANDLGNAAQSYVEEFLRQKLGEDYKITSNGHIPEVTHNDRTLTTFDLSIERNHKYIGIEISFQVTTNSTIERKAGQAQSRFTAISDSGNFIAYIIDGAGNFQRKSALATICQNSHCTVAFTEDEFGVLLKFIREKLND